MVNAMRRKKWSKRFGYLLMPGGDLDGEFARGQKGLVIGLTAAQRITTHHAGAHAQFATDQPVRPVAVHEERGFEQAYPSVRVGAAQEDDLVLLRCFREAGRQAVARRGAVLTGGMTLAVGGNVGTGTPLQGGQVRMAPAVPDFLLPAVIETFDVGLEAGFARRRKDGNDPEAEAEMHHAAQTVGEGVRALKAGVVVELAKSGWPWARQCSTRAARTSAVVKRTRGQLWASWPCKERPLNTSSRGPFLMTRPSTRSNASSSARPSATAGRCQPAGGGGRRRRPVRVSPARAASRARVRVEGAGRF